MRVDPQSRPRLVEVPGGAAFARHVSKPPGGARQRFGRPAFALVGLLAAAGCARTPTPERPLRQAILITIDTLRADHVTPELTPAMEGLARDGVTFEDMVTNSTVTLPSHASMLSGLGPQRHGLMQNDGRLNPSVATLAGLLRDRGFATAAVVSSTPLRVREGIRGLSDGFDFYDQTFDSNKSARSERLAKSPEETTRLAVEWARAHREQSFFLWVHYFPPHGPYLAPPEFLEPGEKPSGETLPVSKVNYEPGAIPAYQRLDLAPDAGLYRSRYAAQVRHVDAQVGRLLNRLRRMGVYQDATVMITSDHGESLGEHNYYFCHGNLAYDEQARVPLLLKLRGGARAGSKITEPVEAVDIMPTLMQAMELAIPAGLDGHSLLGSLPRTRLRFTASEDAEIVSVREAGRTLLVRRGAAHLVSENHPRLELFLSDSDPGERGNRAADQPALARRLEGEILHRFSAILPRPAMDPEVAERLKALGYVR